MNFYNTLELTLDKIAERNVILVGDFNAKHRDWFPGDATNSHGATLKDLMSRFDMVQTCSEPTHLNNDGVPESLLDLVKLSSQTLQILSMQHTFYLQSALPTTCRS